ncbi:hypothetical protein [Thalassoglobus polymorphus]|uniref:Chromosome partition protein Smc n=1 Tax=Thalassoglobus polymorphus TaxID=2527994 RepID=A0A517QGW1_9PLAN|nr:hypothetical protein [Thalassoglobus polymorphus]QDT30872.1 hypothetical protein Mal48_01000 [Thalassoglobus polymorphus]
MSYVGKILVVVQVVLSLLFMAFAGAVYSMHQNWHSKYVAEQTQKNELQTAKQQVEQELALARQDHATKLAEEKARADRFQALNQTLDAQNKGLAIEVEKKETQREEQTGLAMAKQQEAVFRQQEAEKQRIENDKLRVALDTESAKNRDLQDQVFTGNVNLEELRARYDKMLEKTAYLERVVAAHNLETDPDVVEKMKLPPPPVEGLVIDVSKNRANRIEFVQLSIGSDDGLIVSHELDVIRLNEDGTSDWLGRVRVVDIEPNTAVARVILPAKNGIIQKSDTVTSKLGQPAVSLSSN